MSVVRCSVCTDFIESTALTKYKLSVISYLVHYWPGKMINSVSFLLLLI